MFLSELFEHLASGELSQLSMGDIDDLIIQVEDYPKIIPSVNLALTEIYKRFPINIDELILVQYEHISTYHLNKRFAQTNTESSEPYKYIDDTQFLPFNDNILKVEQVFNEIGVELSLNEEVDYGEFSVFGNDISEPFRGRHIDHHIQSVKTPSYNTIQILPAPIEDNNLLIKYRAHHKHIPASANIIPGEIELNIPTAMLEPLLLYIGGRIHANLGGEDPNSGMGFIQRFEASCQKIEDLNLFNKGNAINRKLERAGFV